MTHPIAAPRGTRRDKYGILTDEATGHRLGKRPPKRDPRLLRLNRYATPQLAPPRPLVDHCSFVPSWPMYGNNRYGSCGPAGAGHQIQSWSAYAGAARTPTEDDILRAYFDITGGQDSGVYLEDMFSYWRNRGIAGDMIEAYLGFNPNVTELELVVEHFGSAGIGLSLPDINTYGPWDVVPEAPPNPWNGHYVSVMAYDEAGQMLLVISWAAVYRMSYGFFLKYCDEGLVALNDLMLTETGISPEGWNWGQLSEDLNHLGDPVTPPPPPGPQPNPPGCLPSWLRWAA